MSIFWPRPSELGSKNSRSTVPPPSINQAERFNHCTSASQDPPQAMSRGKQIPFSMSNKTRPNGNTIWCKISPLMRSCLLVIQGR